MVAVTFPVVKVLIVFAWETVKESETINASSPRPEIPLDVYIVLISVKDPLIVVIDEAFTVPEYSWSTAISSLADIILVPIVVESIW